MIYRCLRRIILVLKCLGRVWPPFMAEDPDAVFKLPFWLYSTIPISNAVKAKIPWLPYGAISWLKEYLKPDMRVFEWGSGGSTIFIQKICHIISIENNMEWFKTITRKVNIPIILLKQDPEEYIHSIDEMPDNHFDLVLVDGIKREECITQAVNKLKPGGYLLLDDTEYNNYSKAKEFLDGGDWKRTDFKGPKPFKLYYSQASIWQKPL